MGRAEVARVLFVHPNTVTKYANRGWLPHTRKPSGVRLYDPADVAAAAQRLRRGDGPPRQRRSDAGSVKRREAGT